MRRRAAIQKARRYWRCCLARSTRQRCRIPPPPAKFTETLKLDHDLLSGKGHATVGKRPIWLSTTQRFGDSTRCPLIWLWGTEKKYVPWSMWYYLSVQDIWLFGAFQPCPAPRSAHSGFKNSTVGDHCCSSSCRCLQHRPTTPSTRTRTHQHAPPGTKLVITTRCVTATARRVI